MREVALLRSGLLSQILDRDQNLYAALFRELRLLCFCASLMVLRLLAILGFANLLNRPGMGFLFRQPSFDFRVNRSIVVVLRVILAVTRTRLQRIQFSA